MFEHAEYDTMLRECVRDILRRHRILCLAWEVMPTHMHMIIEDFPDLALSQIVKLVKGNSAYAFFKAFPHLREDLLGGHLWAKGYYTVHIATHDQFCATLTYVRTNRERADLPPPVSLQLVSYG